MTRGDSQAFGRRRREEFEERSVRWQELQDQFPSDLGENACMELGDPDENFLEEYAVYEPFGLTCEKDGLYFEGEKVRYFLDGTELDEGCLSAWRQYWNDEGAVDVHTVRTVIDNGDGSYDPFGELIGMERYSKEEFDRRDLKDFQGSFGGDRRGCAVRGRFLRMAVWEKGQRRLF